MFGYVRAYKPEMKVKEFETYKAVYCALCKEMGKRYGKLTRLSLSYDLTFLALLSVGLSDNPVTPQKKRCVCNPFKKCLYCLCENSYEIPAAASVMTLYYKALDDMTDEKGFKKLAARFLKIVYSKAHKKAAKDFPEIEEICKEYIRQQREVEDTATSDTDAAANPTATFMSSLFCLLAKDEANRRVLHRMGYCLGRWLYLIDALDDTEKDEKSGSYNPFVIKKKCDSEEWKSAAERSIILSESEVQAAHELLQNHRLCTVTENILYLGLEDSRKKVRSRLDERPV